MLVDSYSTMTNINHEAGYISSLYTSLYWYHYENTLVKDGQDQSQPKKLISYIMQYVHSMHCLKFILNITKLRLIMMAEREWCLMLASILHRRVSLLQSCTTRLDISTVHEGSNGNRTSSKSNVMHQRSHDTDNNIIIIIMLKTLVSSIPIEMYTFNLIHLLW